MYRPPVKIIDAPSQVQRRRTEAECEAESTAAAAAPSSIYAQARTIRSLGLTLGLASAAASGSAGSRLRAALNHANEDSDEETGAASVNPRTLHRLARHKPWRNSEADADMRRAIQQQLHAQEQTAAATARPASAIRSTIAARSAQAAAHVAAAASRAAQARAQPAHPAVPPARPLSAAVRTSTPRLTALESSIRTLQADPATWRAPPSTSEPQRPQRPSLFANDATEETRPSDSAASLSRPSRMTARPTSSSSQRPSLAAPASAVAQSAAGRPSRPASAAAVGAHARHTRPAKRPPTPNGSANAIAASTPRPASAASFNNAVAAPPCIVRSFLRLTAPLATRVQLSQMKPLPFVLHSRHTVQFVDEAEVTPSPSLAAALSAAASSSSSRASASAKVRYNPSLPIPPTPPPVFHFDAVFGPAPLSRGDAAEQQAEELFEAMQPIFALPTSNSTQPQQQLTTIAVVSMGVAGSGASETLFGGLGRDVVTAASSLSPRSTLQYPAGLIARFLHSVFAAADDLPRGCSLQLSVSVFVLLPSDTSDSVEGSAIRRATSALDLFRSELMDPMSGEALSAPRWVESRLVFDAASGSASGMTLRRFASAQAACDAIGQARDIWNEKGAPMLRSRPGSFVVSVHLNRRDRLVDDMDGSLLSDSSVSSVIRFFDVPACLREWSLSQLDMLTTSGAMQPAQLAELNELHTMMGLRQTANEQDANSNRRMDCHPRSSCFARLLLPALNPCGRLALLTHIAASGTGALGPRAGTQLARHLCSHFGRPRDVERDGTPPQRPTDGASLLCALQPYSAFLVAHIHPAVQRALPQLYAPLFDIVMDYLGAGPNLSVRLRSKQKQARTEFHGALVPAQLRSSGWLHG